jgi:hypothetical protein
VHRQLAGELPPSGGQRGLVLSGTKQLEPGARAMLLLAEGLFRLDIVLSDDTIKTVVRNLSSGELKTHIDHDAHGPIGIATEEAESYMPGRTRLDFALVERAERVTVEVLIATLRFVERGTVQVTAQAIIRQG